MLKTIRSKMVVLIITLMCVTTIFILFVTKENFGITIRDLHNQLDRDVLQFAMRAIESEYRELVSDEMSVISEQRELMKNIALSALSVLDGYYQLYQTGVLSQEEAKQKSLTWCRQFRYGSDQYFFIYDTALTGVSHPLEEMVGEKWTGFADIRLKDALVLMKETVLRKKSGYTVLFWPRLSDRKLVKQMGYFVYYPKWQWIIGTCVEIGDLTKDSERIRGIIIQKLGEIFGSLNFAGAGYIFLFDGHGNLLIPHKARHEDLAGRIDSITGEPILRRLMEHSHKNQGPLECSFAWGEAAERVQLVHMAYFKALDWYVGCSVFKEDMLAPVRRLVLRQAHILLALLLVGILISAYICKKISRHLATLARYARALPDKNLSEDQPQPVPLLLSQKCDDEVRHLAEAFRFMETQLGKKIREIRKHRNHLEDLVRERTARLSEINAQLGQEVAERSHAEAALRESEAKYRLLFEKSPIGIMHFSPAGVITECNKNFAEIIGISREKLIGFDMLASMKEGPARSAVEMALEFGTGSFEGAYRTVSSGKDIIIRAVHRRIIGDDGAISGAIGIFEDITEKNRLETQLRQAHKMEAVGTLAGGIAHDFNNILGIILGNTELALEDIEEWHPAHFNLKEVRTASLRARDVVRQLLSFSRKTEQERKPLKIVPVVRESLRLLRASIPSNIEKRWNIPADVFTILADATQIQQILINLCANAAHAMSEHGGILKVSLENTVLDEQVAAQYHDLIPGPYVRLTVSDTGHGIPSEIKNRIFDPYFTTKDVGKGTGMGLALVHGIVRSHNGAVSVYSEVEKGTTFRVLLPAIEKEAAADSGGSQALPTGTERLLLVDDEDALLSLARQRLERLGYQVEALADPAEALALFRSGPKRFDLLITDMTMPRMTGDVLTKEILDIRPNLPVILCTGFSERLTEETARQMGIRRYIEKPIDKRDFALAIRQVLDESGCCDSEYEQ